LGAGLAGTGNSRDLDHRRLQRELQNSRHLDHGGVGRRRLLAFLVYPGFELLNLSGPASVFDTANLELRLSGKSPLYAIQVVSPAGGPVTSSGGIGVHSEACVPRP
jgi:transcriptional regulator GlxA family with amidase domain